MSRSLLFITLLASSLLLFLLKSHPAIASKQIFISQAEVSKIINADVAPINEKFDACKATRKTYRNELIQFKKNVKSLEDEIALIRKLQAKVKSNIRNEHKEHKSKLRTLLSNLLKKLLAELAAAKKKVKEARAKLTKQKKACRAIKSQRAKYQAALKLLNMAKANMKYADTYIPQVKAAAEAYLNKYKNLKQTASDHRSSIAKHNEEIKQIKKHHSKCRKNVAALKKDKKEYKQCVKDTKLFSKKLETCKNDKSKADGLNATLDNAKKSLNDKVSSLNASIKNWKKLVKQYKPRSTTPIEDDDEPEEKYTGARTMCYSTGDPHYRSFTGKRFDVYGFEGDFVLVESPDKDFLVETRIQYNKRYANRGLNAGVAIKAESNIFESSGGKLKINGEVKNLPVGKPMEQRDGVIIKRINSIVYRVDSPDGGRVQFQQNRIGSNFYYHQVYVYVPNAWVGKTRGLCSGAIPNSKKIKSLQVTDKSKMPRLFGVKYNPPAGNHAVAHLKWPSRGFQKQAQDLCYKAVGKHANLYYDCLMDAKVSGNLDLIKDYAEERKTTKQLDADDKNMRHGPLGGAYRYLARLLSELSVQDKQLEKYNVVKELKGLNLDTNLAFQVEGIASRMKHEIKEVRALQAQIAKKIM